MQNEYNIQELSYDDRKLLRDFFITVYEWMLNHINPSKEDLKEFIKMYEDYLNCNNLNDKPILKQFLLELKNDLLSKYANDESSVIKNHFAIIKSPLFIQNKTILKWYRVSKLERHIFNYSKVK